MAFSRCLALLPALAFTLAATPIRAAQAAPPETTAQAPTVQTTTKLVLIDVVVSQKDQLIHGLDKAKFHVFENGEDQPILSFEEHRAPAEPAAGAGRVIHSELPPHTYTNVPDYPESGAVNVFLLDALNTPISAQMNLRRRMIDYLANLKPGTMLAVFTLTTRLRMVTGFTSDIAAVRDMLKSPKGSPQSSMLPDESATPQAIAAEQSSGLNGIGGVSASAQAMAMEGANALQEFETSTESFQTDQRVQMTLDAMQQLARMMSAIPERKNILWFSAAFPVVIFPEPGLSTESNLQSFNSMRDYAGQVRDTTQLLADARVAIYPMDPRGLMTSAEFDASTHSSNSGPAMQQHMQREQDLVWAQHAAMSQIAQETGGKAFWNTNDLANAVDEVMNEGSNYYTIGYAPAARKFDGQFHTFQVRLEDSSYKLAYRDGYFADAPDASRTHHAPVAPIVAASVHGVPNSSQIAFDARILPATDPKFASAKSALGQAPGGEMTASLKGPLQRHVVDLLIDPRTLRLDPAPDGSHKANFEMALVAYDQQGNRLNYVEHTYEISIPAQRFEAAMKNNGLAFRTVIDLPGGQLWLRIALHDVLADTTGALEAPVWVARATPGPDH